MIGFFNLLSRREFGDRSDRTDIDQLFDPMPEALVNDICGSVNIDGMYLGICLNFYPDNTGTVDDIDLVVLICFKKLLKGRLVKKIAMNDFNPLGQVLFCRISIQDKPPYTLSTRRKQTADIAAQKAGCSSDKINFLFRDLILLSLAWSNNITVERLYQH